VYTLNAEFSETTTNWNNQPGMLIPYSDFSVPSDQVVHSLEVSGLVDLWRRGADPNHGVAVLKSNSGWLRLYSREESDPDKQPHLHIVCGASSPTPSPTRTRTPTRTSTPTQTKTPGPVTVNLEAIQLEVTQGLQDAIDNHVRLVEGKRTFARFHVFADDTAPAPGKQYRATAALQIWRGGTFLGTLKPINNAAGVINVPPSTFDPSTWPPRVDDSFPSLHSGQACSSCPTSRRTARCGWWPRLIQTTRWMRRTISGITTSKRRCRSSRCHRSASRFTGSGGRTTLECSTRRRGISSAASWM
jgi:hypothetical protein